VNTQGLERTNVVALQSRLSVDLNKAPSAAQAAQVFCSAIRERWGDVFPLVRLYLTTPLHALPKFNRDFVADLVKGAGVEAPRDTTPVLSLLGTSGVEAAWNDRRRSKGHISIPLLSSRFVQGIPMISRMLQQLEAGVDWLDSQDLKQVEAAATRLAGLFYVKDAATETDRQGRKIIPAQDFVSAHGIKTVFGIAGGYPSGNLAVAIVFAKENLDETVCKNFKGLINVFKAATLSAVMGGRVFELE
jgi:hypothetical protein